MGISLNGFNSGMADTYSTLLGGMGGGDDAGGMSSLLGDYAAIKNGSYGKMLKTYYAKLEKQEAEESGKTDSKKAGKVKDSASASAAKSLYGSASALGSLNYDDRSERAKMPQCRSRRSPCTTPTTRTISFSPRSALP